MFLKCHLIGVPSKQHHSFPSLWYQEGTLEKTEDSRGLEGQGEGRGQQVMARATSRGLTWAIRGDGGLEGAMKEGGYLRSELKSSTKMISWIRLAGVRFRTLEQ